MFSSALPKLPETVGGKITQDALGEFWGVMLGAWRVDRSLSRLAVGKRRLLGAVAFGALPLLGGLTSLGPAWGQVSETLPEVNGAEENDPQTGAANGPCSRPTGGHTPRGLPACALDARSRRHYAVPISVRRSDAHHRSRH